MNYTQQAHLLLGNTAAALEIHNEIIPDLVQSPKPVIFAPEPLEVSLENEVRSPTLSPSNKSKKGKKGSNTSSDILSRKIAVNDSSAPKNRSSVPSYPHISMRMTLSEFEKIRNKCAKDSKYLDFIMASLQL